MFPRNASYWEFLKEMHMELLVTFLQQETEKFSGVYFSRKCVAIVINPCCMVEKHFARVELFEMLLFVFLSNSNRRQCQKTSFGRSGKLYHLYVFGKKFFFQKHGGMPTTERLSDVSNRNTALSRRKNRYILHLPLSWYIKGAKQSHILYKICEYDVVDTNVQNRLDSFPLVLVKFKMQYNGNAQHKKYY